MTQSSITSLQLNFFRTIIAAAALLHCGASSAQSAAQVVPASQPSASNAVTQAAVQQGVLSCASRINQVTNFLGFNAQSGALLMVPPGQPDQRLLPVAIENVTETGPAYLSATFAPNQANGCGVTYDAIVYWTMNCEIVAVKQFGFVQKVGKLKKDITVLDGGVATKVFLMPAGSGCVSIKKEVVL